MKGDNVLIGDDFEKTVNLGLRGKTVNRSSRQMKGFEDTNDAARKAIFQNQYRRGFRNGVISTLVGIFLGLVLAGGVMIWAVSSAQ